MFYSGHATAADQISAKRQQRIEKADLEPGDILLRRPFADHEVEEKFSAAMEIAQLLLAGDVGEQLAGQNGLGELIDFLIACFDPHGFCSASIISDIPNSESAEKLVFELVAGGVCQTPLSQYSAENITAYRYCSGAVALGDLHMPYALVAEQLAQMTEAMPVRTNTIPETRLAMLALSIWRQCGSFDIAAVREVVLEVFPSTCAPAVEAFFQATDHKLQIMLWHMAEWAVGALNQEAVLASEFVATVFNEANNREGYAVEHPENSSGVGDNDAAHRFANLSPLLIYGELQKLASVINQADFLPAHTDTDEQRQALAAKMASMNALFLPSDIARSNNTFPLGLVCNTEHGRVKRVG